MLRPHSGAASTVHIGAMTLHVPVSVTTGLGCMRKKSPWSQQGILGDTQPAVPLRDSPFSTRLRCSCPELSRRPCSSLHGLPNGGTHNSLVSI